MNEKKDFVSLQGIDFIEFAVKDLEKASELYERLDFNCVGMRGTPERKSKLYVQNDVRVVLTAGIQDKDPISHFVQKHGDGVINVAYQVNDPKVSIDIATHKGAKKAFGVAEARAENGKHMQASAIHVYGDTINSFIHYEKGASLEDFFTEKKNTGQRKKGFFQTVDHITVNVEKGQMDRWAEFYTNIFNFSQVRYFDIHTDRTGLLSRALRSPAGHVTMPFNEPTEDKSQIQEFIDTYHGPGVQHIALHTAQILPTISTMSDRGFKFLTVPSTYYEELPNRVPNIVEKMNELEKLGILVDGDQKGYLLQIFTQNLVGPFFYEVIQRKHNNGFGEGNFRALFEAIERDQIKRGILN